MDVIEHVEDDKGIYYVNPCAYLQILSIVSQHPIGPTRCQYRPYHFVNNS